MFSYLAALVSLLAAIPIASALPSTPAYKRHATHQTRTLPNGFTISTYHPKATFEVYQRGIARRELQSNSTDYRGTGLDFIRTKFANDSEDESIEIHSEYEGPHVSHVWVRQTKSGIPVANTLANVAVNKNGDVVSYSSNFVKSPSSGNSFTGSSSTVKTTATLTANEAEQSATKTLGGRVDSKQNTTLVFLALEDGNLKLTHSVRVHTDDGGVVQAFVDADDGEVRGLVDYTADISMRAVPITKHNPNEAYAMVVNPEDRISSPHGWNVDADGDVYNSTVGNNVLAAKGDPDALSVDQRVALAANMTSEGTFDYAFNPHADPSKGSILAAATVNAWHVANYAHDILYRYGFTERAFNFQDSNWGKGGKEADMVFLSVQDESGYDNANFRTLPDGEPAVMRMYLWDAFNPMRDGDLDNTIVLHEYTHGLTNRLTGGGTAQCLQSTEARGLGEGFSDAFANWVSQSAGTHIADFAIGTYVSGSATGVRTYPYSTNHTVNPLTYKDVKGLTEIHQIGEVWAQALHSVHASLVRSLGGSLDALTNPDAVNGHTVFLHAFVDALALQPCNPTFSDARLAFVQAEHNRYGGKYSCAIWEGFALTGLGQGADNYVNSHAMPSSCYEGTTLVKPVAHGAT